MTETLDQKQGASDAGVPPLPHYNRRPRAREVSSRFMSPMVSFSSSSSTSGDVKSPLPKHAISTSPAVTSPAESQASRYYQQQQRSSKSTTVLQRRPQEQEPPLFCCADETTSRSSDTPLGSQNNNNNRSSSSVVMPLQRKPRAAVKLYKENNNGAETTVQMKQQQHHHPDLLQAKGKSLQGRNGNNISSVATPSSSSSSSRPRPDTPVVVTERIIPSRFRHSTQNFQRQTNIGAGAGAVPAGAPTSAAAKLLLSSGLSMSAQPSSSYPDPQEARSVCDRDPEECSIITYTGASSIQNSRVWSSSDIMRSSMPEGDTRLLAAERSCSTSTTTSTSVSDSSNFSKFSPCSRSLNFSSSSNCCEHPSSSLVHALKTPVSVSLLSKPSAKMGSFFLPPHHPTCIKLGADARKGRKVFTHQEDVHSLKLLHNHYLQWRFANAKADLSMHAQRRETEVCSDFVLSSYFLEKEKKI